jgi:hypothetical protein
MIRAAGIAAPEFGNGGGYVNASCTDIETG